MFILIKVSGACLFLKLVFFGDFGLSVLKVTWGGWQKKMNK